MTTGRKVGKTHQNVLVFVKGDWRKATEYCGAIDVDTGSAIVTDIVHPPDPDPDPRKQMPADAIAIKISAASARQKFHGCTPDFILSTCKARCCDAPTRPTGTMITIHPTEQSRIESLGGVVVEGLLQSRPGCRVCPFKQTDHLCGIHGIGTEPFGCIASPFTLNRNRTLIIRNRYRLLPCYDAGPRLPAYVAFRASLDMLFGGTEAARICDHLDGGGGDIVGQMPAQHVQMLQDNDQIKHSAANVPAAG
jgi:hypothetical protein